MPLLGYCPFLDTSFLLETFTSLMQLSPFAHILAKLCLLLLLCLYIIYFTKYLIDNIKLHEQSFKFSFPSFHGYMFPVKLFFQGILYCISEAVFRVNGQVIFSWYNCRLK